LNAQLRGFVILNGAPRAPGRLLDRVGWQNGFEKQIVSGLERVSALCCIRVTEWWTVRVSRSARRKIYDEGAREGWKT
jgi:hypothetical protein